LTPPIVAVVGWSDSGKTTLIARLVDELNRRGLRVGVVKRAEHALKLDPLITDSARLSGSGALSVAVLSPDGVLRLDAHGATLHGLSASMDVDIVLAEGFKREPGVPKIEIRRTPDVPPCVSDRLALVCDELSDADFRRDDIVGITDLLLGKSACPALFCADWCVRGFNILRGRRLRWHASSASQPGSNAVVRSVPGMSSGLHSHPGAPGQYCPKNGLPRAARARSVGK
jgi:molybdopterin-guanine dinucleotide biosynthesis protein B